MIVPFSTVPTNCSNILHYLHPENKGEKLCFDRKKYPADDNIWLLLKREIKKAALNAGSNIVSNGGGGVDRRRFVCACGRRYKEGKN